MKDFKYKILNPGGNKTALVYGTNFTKEERQEINNKILAEDKDVEQVGFLSQTEKRLEMAGGEFCVNATRCSIYEYLKGKCGTTSIHVSGYNGDITGGIEKNGTVYANLKFNKNIDKIIQNITINGIGCCLIKLDGIWQIIMEEGNSKQYIDMLKIDESKAKLLLKSFMATVPTAENAIGIILMERQGESIKINPVIWVKTVDTLYYETACGSGSLAYAIYNYAQNKGVNVDLVQPSGYTIKIKLDCKKNKINNAKVSGVVSE